MFPWSALLPDLTSRAPRRLPPYLLSWHRRVASVGLGEACASHARHASRPIERIRVDGIRENVPTHRIGLDYL